MMTTTRDEERRRRVWHGLLAVVMAAAVAATFLGGIDSPYDTVTVVVCGLASAVAVVSLFRRG